MRISIWQNASCVLGLIVLMGQTAGYGDQTTSVRDSAFCGSVLTGEMTDFVQGYLHQASAAPLLKREEERELRTQYLNARALVFPNGGAEGDWRHDSVEAAQRNKETKPERTNQEQRWIANIAALFKAVEKGKAVGRTNRFGPRQMQIIQLGIEARNRMVVSNMLLVAKIAKAYVGLGMEYEDLIGEGNLALLRAVDEFDLDYGTRFSTLASYWIKQGIRNALTHRSRAIRLPADVVAKVGKFRAAAKKLHEETGIEPSFDQVCTHMGLTNRAIEILRKALASQPRFQSSRASADGDEDGFDFDPISDYADDSETDPEFAEEVTAIRKALENLKRIQPDGPRLAEVLRLRYFEGMTLKRIGKRFGISAERVRQLEEQGHELLPMLMKQGGVPEILEPIRPALAG